MAKGPKDQAVSERLPVARVAVDISLAHLDRPFDYLVPATMDETAVPGCRVRVRFAGQLVDGYLLDRTQTSEHQGRLSRLERVISPEPVLTPEIFALARSVADRYAGTLADVLRLAIPPRHAAAEREAPTTPDAPHASHAPDAPATAPLDPAPSRPEPGSWTRYPAGETFLAALAEGRPVRAAWSALPGPEWPAEIAIAAATTAAAGRGVVIVVPDARDLARVDAALTAVNQAENQAENQGAEGHVCLTADLGPAERYRRWLAVLRGTVRVVAGTRAAMFAPVCQLGLVVLWDDGDDLHAEPRAPYPNAREVLALRAHQSGAAALIGGFARTAELTQLVAAGWAKPLVGRPEVLRQVAPRVRAAPDEAELARDAAAMTARLPSLALRTARTALAGDPRSSTARSGNRPQQLTPVTAKPCPGRSWSRFPGAGTWPRSPAPAAAPRPGAPYAAGRCASAGPTRCRAAGGAAPWPPTGPARGADPTACARWSPARPGPRRSWAAPFPTCRCAPRVASTCWPRCPPSPPWSSPPPGPNRWRPGGYAAALLLDGWALLGRPSLRAAEETLRRWLNAAALVRPAGSVVVLAEASLPAVQALVRWDPVGFAERELAERAELGFPPAVRMAAVTGPSTAVAEFVGSAALPDRAEILGPIPAEILGPAGPNGAEPDPEPAERALIRIPRTDGLALARALHAAQAARSARKDGAPVRVQLDPAEVA